MPAHISRNKRNGIPLLPTAASRRLTEPVDSIWKCGLFPQPFVGRHVWSCAYMQICHHSLLLSDGRQQWVHTRRHKLTHNSFISLIFLRVSPYWKIRAHFNSAGWPALYNSPMMSGLTFILCADLMPPQSDYLWPVMAHLHMQIVTVSEAWAKKNAFSCMERENESETAAESRAPALRGVGNPEERKREGTRRETYLQMLLSTSADGRLNQYLSGIQERGNRCGGRYGDGSAS